MPTLIVLPQKILNKACDLSSKQAIEKINERIAELVRQNKYEDALPYSAAAFFKTQNLDTLSSLGRCCHQAARFKIGRQKSDSDLRDYLNTAINIFTVIIDDNCATSLTYSMRGEMYLLKAQFDNVPQLLESAESDCSRAIALGSPIRDHVEKQIQTIKHVRDLMSRR